MIRNFTTGSASIHYIESAAFGLRGLTVLGFSVFAFTVVDVVLVAALFLVLVLVRALLSV